MRRERSSLPRPADPQSAGAAANRLDREAREPGRGSRVETCPPTEPRVPCVDSSGSSARRTVAGRSAKLTAAELLSAFGAADCDARRAAGLLRVTRRSFDRWSKALGIFATLGRMREERATRLNREQSPQYAALVAEMAERDGGAQ